MRPVRLDYKGERQISGLNCADKQRRLVVGNRVSMKLMGPTNGYDTGLR